MTFLIFSFTINLHSTQADFSGHDVPLHVSVRFDEGKVILFFLELSQIFN